MMAWMPVRPESSSDMSKPRRLSISSWFRMRSAGAGGGAWSPTIASQSWASLSSSAAAASLIVS